MKRVFGMVVAVIMLCTLAACSPQNSGIEESTSAPEAATVATTAELPDDLKETIEANDFEGVICAVKDGETIVSFADGKLENGEDIAIDTPMPIGSVSKQFCTAAVMLLQEQGKLSVDVTLDKYYPDYPEGGKITIHDLLSMRSGIPEITEESGADVTMDHTEKENIEAIKQWVFSQKLDFEPDSAFVYANINYLLLSDIVSQVSGKKYIDFLRENFFTPLGMMRTGSIIELPDDPSWAQGAVYSQVDQQPGLTNGCGDVISNAADMTAWMNALTSGKVVSPESYKAMTTDHNDGEGYGYGMFTDIAGGVGHYGAIGIYSAFDYINIDNGFTLFAASNTIYPPDVMGVVEDMVADLMK